ncbi:MAG: T9SS type A sorting domain-containing protein [Sphingobacteriales bacterium]|nr:MAG: T9SS type A sorting domain-containing protein [Sphingobacteriales bacterium]
MNTFYKSVSAAGLLLAAVTGFQQQAHAQLTSGNIVVLQVGDGTAAFANSGNAVYLKEFNRTTAGQSTPVSTITISTSGAQRLVIGGTATSEGSLTLSADSTKLVFAGYDTSVTNTANLGNASAANIRRVIDTVGSSGIAGRADSTASAFSGNNFRGAVKGTGEDYWGVGGTNGVYYFGNAAAPTVLGTGATNIRVLQTMNGNLYYTSGSAAYLGINKISGLPTSGTNTGTLLFNTGTNSSPYGLAINATETIAYVADDRVGAGGGIQKWANTNGTWAVADTILVGGGARGLAVDWSGTYPKIYATTIATTGNALVMAIDSSYAAGFANSYITLATAPTNTVFRGVAFTPKASCIIPTVTVTSTNITCASAGSATATASGNGAFTYAWTGPNSFSATTASITNLTNAGTYTVTVTASGGCIVTASATITNTSTLTATANAAGSTTFCQGDSVRLRANRATGYTYQWFSGSTQVSGATDSFYVARTSGSYRVRITNGSCVDTSSAIAVTVNPKPVVTISIARDTTFCQGDSVVLSVPPATNYTYQWSRNRANITGATMLTYTANQTGNYSVRVTSNTGCTDTSRIVMVTAKPTPMPVITSVNGLLSLSNTTGYTNLQWMLGGTPVNGANGATYVPAANGTYALRVDSNGCTGMSNPIIVTNAAVISLSGKAVQVYPNPATTTVLIQPSGNYQVRLSDLQGREVLRTHAASEIYIGNLANGIYQLQLTNSTGETVVLKLVKGD